MAEGLARPFPVILLALAATLLLPAAVAHGASENTGIYLAASFAAAFAGGATALASGASPPDTAGREVLVLVGVWLLVPAFAAAPFIESAGGIGDAYLEALSAFTTTGASIIDPARAGNGVLAWRCVLQAMGGAASIVLAAAVLARTAAGSPPGYARPAKLGLNQALAGASRVVLPAYAGLLVMCFVLLVMTGVPGFEAFCLASGALSTGGLAGRTAAAGHGAPAMLVLVPFMAVGAASLVWIVLLGRAGPRAGRGRGEAIALGLAIAVPGLLVTAALVANGQGGAAFGDGVFAAASLATTTGFPPTAEALRVIPPAWMLIAVLVGGGAVSAAGGIRLLRFGLLAELLRHELVRLVYPNVVLALRPQSAAADPLRRSAVAGVFALAVLFLALSTILVATSHPSFEGALVLAIAGLTNTGPLYLGWIGGEGWPAVAALDAPAKIAFALAMIAGRLDFLAFAVLFDPRLWRG